MELAGPRAVSQAPDGKRAVGSHKEPGPSSLILSLPGWSSSPHEAGKPGLTAQQEAGGGTEAELPTFPPEQAAGDSSSCPPGQGTPPLPAGGHQPC